jgi:hypothetical protein
LPATASKASPFSKTYTVIASNSFEQSKDWMKNESWFTLEGLFAKWMVKAFFMWA